MKDNYKCIVETKNTVVWRTSNYHLQFRQFSYEKWYCIITFYEYLGIVLSTSAVSLGHNFLVVHGVTFRDGILNVLHRRRLKEEKS